MYPIYSMGIPLPRFPSLKISFWRLPSKKSLERNCMILKITNNTTHYGKKPDINTLKSTYIYVHIDLQNKTTTLKDRKHKYKNKETRSIKKFTIVNILHIIHYIDVYNFHNHL